ncbi:MAG: rane fusion protein multidrug efflux system [Chthoniobacter sp.]|nr:rane fusion protein multidrug efflux system [Chthoniobacter sp.]
MLVMLCLAILLIAGIAFWKYTNIKKGMAMGAKFAPPPTAVTTVVVKPQTWQPVLSAVGSMKAVNGVTVSTDLAGIVSEIAFESGTPVKKGTLLVKLDTDQEEAQLRVSVAKLSLSKTDLERKRDLVAKKAIAQSEWDTAQSQVAQMDAEVAGMRAIVARKRITAPFDGLVGIRQVNVGQYLQPGAPIAPLQSMDPIYVEFALPQQHFETISIGKKLRLGASGIAGERFEGEITAIDSRVDENTRNVLVQGTVGNAEQKLRPGMFVDVEVLLPEKDGVLAIPTSSIAYAPYGDSIYIVKDQPGPGGKSGKTVQQQFVKLGPKRGDQVSILSGLKAGDEIVSSGVFKLRPGAAVQVNNAVQPGNDLAPKPEDS